MKRVSKVASLVVGLSLAAGGAVAGASVASADSISGYKYCSGSAYGNVQVRSQAAAPVVHYHQTGNGNFSVASPAGYNTFTSWAGWASDTWLVDSKYKIYNVISSCA